MLTLFLYFYTIPEYTFVIIDREYIEILLKLRKETFNKVYYIGWSSIVILKFICKTISQ